MKVQSGQVWYDLEDFRQLRAKPEAFFNFCMYFLPVVTGRLNFRNDRVQLAISEIATVSDEAFTLLLLENNWNKWKEQAYVRYKEIMKADETTVNEDMELEKQIDEAREKRLQIREEAQQNGVDGCKTVNAEVKKWNFLNQSLWTEGKRTGYKFEGWSVKGMIKFNELTSTVTKDRGEPHANGVEQRLKKIWGKAESTRNSKWKKQNRPEENNDETENRPMEYQLPQDTLDFLAKLDNPENDMQSRDTTTARASV
jgi:hypothetical protein